jgi:hypothetical protein
MKAIITVSSYGTAVAKGHYKEKFINHEKPNLM